VYGFATWALQGYEHACARLGLAPISASGSASSDAMAAAATRLLDDHPEVTAVIAPQELSAVGVLRACHARGVTIPHDLSVIAMIGDSMSELATPPLTTIDFPAEELGRTAARNLVDRLDSGDNTLRQVLVRPGLTVRGTTAPPARH
jgi:LacI family transcriptional regulator